MANEACLISIYSLFWISEFSGNHCFLKKKAVYQHYCFGFSKNAFERVLPNYCSLKNTKFWNI